MSTEQYKDRTERLSKWAGKLTKKQMRDLLVEVIDFAMDAEEVRFGDSCVPYWTGNGEPLVVGQIPFEGE